MTRYEFLLMLLRLRDKAMLSKGKTMKDVLICERCKDAGYLIGTTRCETNPTLNKSWTEVCPYCMPTNKYGNLQKILKKAPQLLEHKPPPGPETRE